MRSKLDYSKFERIRHLSIYAKKRRIRDKNHEVLKEMYLWRMLGAYNKRNSTFRRK